MAAASPATSASSSARSACPSGCSRLAVISTSSGAMVTAVVRPGVPGTARGGRRARRAQRAADQPEQRDQRVGGTGDDGVGILTRHEPRREVEADLRLAFALFGGAPRFVEPRDRPAQHAGCRRERDQRDEVVALLHVEALARRGEEVVQGEEGGHRADDRADPTEERGEQRGDEEEERGGGEVDVEQASDRGRDTDDGHREERLGAVLDDILTAHRRALTAS